MSAIDQYKQIQTNLAAKKQSLVDAQATPVVTPTNTSEASQRVEALQQKVLDQNAQKKIDPNALTAPPVGEQTQPPVQPQAPATPVVTPPVEPVTPIAPKNAPTTPETAITKTPEQVQSEKYQAFLDGRKLKMQTAADNKLKSNMSLYSNGKSLYDGVTSGSILPGSKEFSDLTSNNPNLLADYNAVKTQNDNNTKIKALGNAIIGDETTDIVAPKPETALDSLVSYFTKSMDTDVGEEYKNAVTSNPEYQSSVTKYNDLNQQIADNNKNIQALSTDIRKKYSAGTPESLIASAIARDAKPLLEQGLYLSQLQKNAESEMTRIFDENREMFSLKQQERTENRNIAFQLYNTINAENIRQEDIQRKDEELKKQIEYEEKIHGRDRNEKLDDLKKQEEYNLKIGLLQAGVDPTGLTSEEMSKAYADAVKKEKDAQLALDYAKIKPVETPSSSTTNVSTTPGPITTITLNNGQNITTGENVVQALNNAVSIIPNIKFDAQNAYRTADEQAKLYGKGRTAEELQKDGVNPAYAQPGVPKVTWTLQSEHMKGNAVDVIGDKNYLDSIEERMNQAGFIRPQGTMARGDYGHFEFVGQNQQGTERFSSGDIALFNGSKYNPQTEKDPARLQRYYDYQNAKAELETSENPDIYELMRSSAGLPKLDTTTNKAYKDMNLVVSQLGGLNTAIEKYNDDKWFGDFFSPITAIISNNNPWDTKAADVKARLQAVVPKVARGIFGEVGVLTDQDIANYIQTLPNIKQTAAVQDVVQLALLGTLKNALDSAVLVDSGTYNVSGIAPVYKQLQKRITELENKVQDKQNTGLSSSDKNEALNIK